MWDSIGAFHSTHSACGGSLFYTYACYFSLYSPFFVSLHAIMICDLLGYSRLLEGSVKILPELELPAHPYGVYASPAHIRDSCHATQLVARTPECTLHTRTQLQLCRNRLQVQYGQYSARHLKKKLIRTPFKL